VNFSQSHGVVLGNLGCSHSVIIKEVGPLGSGLFFLNKVSFQTNQKPPNQNLIFVVSNFQLIGLLLLPFCWIKIQLIQSTMNLVMKIQEVFLA